MQQAECKANERASLFVRAADSAACPVIRLQCSDDEMSDSEGNDSEVGSDVEQEGGTTEYAGGGTPDNVEAAHWSRYRHAMLAPWAAPPTPDPRQLFWLKIMCSSSTRGPFAYGTQHAAGAACATWIGSPPTFRATSSMERWGGGLLPHATRRQSRRQR